VVKCHSCGKKNRLSLVAGNATQKCGHCKVPLPRSRVILCDVSSSMAELSGERRKIDILAEALDQALNRMDQCLLIAFSSFPTLIESVEDLPSPNGGTALHLALEEAYEFAPERTLVISDGQPDSRSDALAAAEDLTGRIDVIYVGPDDDVDALDFMRSLARQSGGELVIEDLEEDDYEDDYEIEDNREGLIENIQRLLLPEN
jgi:hypothetical protein